MGNKKRGKLGLKKDTLRRLDAQDMASVAGGAYIYNFQLVNVNLFAYQNPVGGSGAPSGAYGTKFTYTCTCTG